MAGTYLARLAVFFSGAAQLALFAAVMIVAAYFMFRENGSNSAANGLHSDFSGKSMSYGLIVVEGLAVGVLTGLVGVGGFLYRACARGHRAHEGGGRNFAPGHRDEVRCRVRRILWTGRCPVGIPGTVHCGGRSRESRRNLPGALRASGSPQKAAALLVVMEPSFSTRTVERSPFGRSEANNCPTIDLRRRKESEM